MAKEFKCTSLPPQSLCRSSHSNFKFDSTSSARGSSKHLFGVCLLSKFPSLRTPLPLAKNKFTNFYPNFQTFQMKNAICGYFFNPFHLFSFLSDFRYKASTPLQRPQKKSEFPRFILRKSGLIKQLQL